jgi:3-oxoacyl-[acyl-carrier protein] reductase
MDDLKGKRVLITGAGGIIGRWLAEAFAGAGASLCLTDVQADAVTMPALGEGADGFIHEADLRDAAQIEALAGAVGARWGAADVLVNNAGVYPSGFLLDIDAAEWDRIFDVNLRAPFLLTSCIARQMIGAGVRGSIVNISSGAAGKMRRSVVPYCISKTALDRLTKGCALELAEYGIRVNALEPGFAPGSTVSELSPAHVAAVTGNIPLGRLTTREDVGRAALFLASDASAYVTGTSLAVDGGFAIGSLVVYQDKKTAL